MSLPRLRVLLAAALFSLVVVVPFLPTANTGSRSFAVEARIASSVDGVAKLYFDAGRGYSETDSVALTLMRSSTPRPYRFALPGATYHSLRLDPIDGPGEATLDGPIRIVADTGRVLRTIPLTELTALQQIASLTARNGQLEVVTTSTADDPQLLVPLGRPLVARLTALDFLILAGPSALGVFAALVVLLLVAARMPRAQRRTVDVARRLLARPAAAVMLVAAGAVVASAYPLVFLGKSYVSPNFGTTLLYDGYPTLPGYSSRTMPTVNGSDVAAAMLNHVPYAFMQRRALEQAELPLWNRYTLTGTPLLAQGQSMFGDPLHFMVLLFDGAAWAWDLKYLLSKWLFAAGIGLSALALLAGQRTAVPTSGALGPALLVTLAAPFVGFFLYRINHPAFFSVGYAPWVFYCWIRLLRANGRRPAAGWLAGLLLANVALMNSGTVKEAYLLTLQMNFAGACVLLASKVPWRIRLLKLAGAVWIGALLLLITAPVWATFLATLPHAYTAAAHRVANQIQPALILGAFDELFFRHLSQGEIVFNPSLNILLLLGVLYFAATLPLHLPDRELMAVAACAVLAMTVVFGVIPPAWIAQLPLLGNVWHIDNCFLGGLLVLWSVLAAAGFRSAAVRLSTPAGRTDLIVAGAILFAMVGAWIGFRQAAHRAAYGPGTTFSVVETGEVIAVSPFLWGSLAALLLASLGLALIARHALTQRALGPAGALGAALCVLVLLWRHGAHASSLGFEPYVLQPPPRVDFHAASSAIEYTRARHAVEPGRLFGLQGNVTPGWNAVYGLEAIHGPDALQHRPVRELIDVSPLEWNSGWSVYLMPGDAASARPFLDALNVRYYVDAAGNPPLADPSLKLVHAADLNVYESSTAWPRAFFTDSFTTYTEPADLVQKFIASDGRPLAAVQRDEAASHPALSRLPRDAPQRTITPASGYRLTGNTTRFAIRAERAGLVVLTEAWWPWAFEATINGRAAPILRVNHAFKAVLVDAPGEYQVTFSYWPQNFSRYLAFHASGVLLALGSLILAVGRGAQRTG